MAEDYYDTLGVKRDASQADIQKAYRDMARKYHPDLHPDDKSAKKKFQQVQKAFEVLNDASKREMYDRYGSAFEQMGSGGPQPNPWAGGQPGPGGASFDEIDLSQLFGERYGQDPGGGFGDIFNQFRRAGKRGKRAAEPTRGGDLETEMQIPFNTAITGGEVQLSVQRHDGHVENIAVKIPAGIDDGKKVRVRGQGEPGPGGGPPGDIIIKVRVAPHPYFTRRDRDLLVRLPITLSEAAQGAKVDVPTPWGEVALRLPPGTSSGKKFRVRGHGVRGKGYDNGDLYAETQIVLPSKLDEESLELIRQLEAHQPTPNPRTELRW